MRSLYKNKPLDYYNSVRREITSLLPAYASNVLEIGCGTGATLDWLKHTKRCSMTTGIEMSEGAAQIAKNVADQIIVADVEQDQINFPDNYFDLILCLDVLEHLRDPWTVMKRAERWLNEEGLLIVSVPNLRYRTIMMDLLFRCRFEYQDIGVMDKTHLRFFTKKSAIGLLKAAGFHSVRVVLHPERIKGLMLLANLITLGYFRDMLSWQILLTGKKH